MELGLIGLGRMGSNMTRRLMRAGHRCVVYDIHPEAVQALVKEGAQGVDSLQQFVHHLPKAHIIWLMVPAGMVDRTLSDLIPHLDRDDIVIDGGNSHYHDDIRRATELSPKGIHYVDVGTSGGVWGLDRGFCLMIGGDKDIVERLAPIFAALAPGMKAAPRTTSREKAGGTAEQGYLHCGASGAGHFVKMVHNGIEYGLMAAYAEGLNILRHADVGNRPPPPDAETAPLRHPDHYRYTFDLADIAEVWRRGSVIASWLLDLTSSVLIESPDLSQFSGRVSDSREGRWTINAALDEAVPAPVLSAALYQWFSSRGKRSSQTKCCPPCGVSSEDTRGKGLDPYERLLGDAMRGDPMPFARNDGVEAAWRALDPILKTTTPLYEYAPNTWGPREADGLIGGDGWQNPQRTM